MAATLALAACGDPFEPSLIPVPEQPEEATLFDFRLGGLRDPAAFDLLEGRAVRTDQASGWDFLFEITESGQTTLVPRGAALDAESDAGLQHADTGFEAIEDAPRDGYVQEGPVVVEEGDVLLAVSRRDPAFPSLRCRLFAKLEVLALDSGERTVTFRHLINPNCEQRSLRPGDEGD